MSIVASDAAHRRVAPRFENKLAAELAAGSALIPVKIHDLSSTGCGIEILSLPIRSEQPVCFNSRRWIEAVVLPVMLLNMQFEGES